MRPAFLDRLLGRTQPPVPDVSCAGRVMAEAKRNRDRNRIIDVANEMRARQGRDTMIPRRPT